MMRQVMYLCGSASSELGLMFPDELDEDLYLPGSFYIEEVTYITTDQNNIFDNVYSFDAIYNNSLIGFELKHIRNGLFFVDTKKFGGFYFEASPIFPFAKYIGTKPFMSNHNKLWLLKCTDNARLEMICRLKGFFFVGSTDRRYSDEE